MRTLCFNGKGELHNRHALTRVADGCGPVMVLAQFNGLDHPHCFGWHLYPRKDFINW